MWVDVLLQRLLARGGRHERSGALWAALTAVINSSCKRGSVGFDAPKLYEAAATPGYDMASGLGSPVATGLAKSLC